MTTTYILPTKETITTTTTTSPKHITKDFTHHIHRTISRAPQSGTNHLKDLTRVVLNLKMRLNTLLGMTPAVTIATHEDAGNNREMTKTPTTCVLPHARETVSGPDTNGVVSLRK